MAPKAVTAPASATVDPGADQDALAAGIQALRDNLQKAGTALGVASTTILGGLGWATLHNLFPAPAGKTYLYWIAFLGAGMAAAGAATLTGQFLAGQRRVLVSATPPPDEKTERRKWGLSSRDLELINLVFGDHAADEGARNLHMLELRALRLERVARRRGGGEDDALAQEAGRLHGVVRIALTRAAATVIEARAHDAVAGLKTKLALGAALLGVLLLWGAADYSKGQRDLIDLRKQCVEAVKLGASTACEPVVSSTDLADQKKAEEGTKRKTAEEARKKKAATARTIRDIEGQIAGAGIAAIERGERCAKVVASRLAAQPEAVRIATVRACVAGLTREPTG